ncbi:helicase associated domain-containing protein [Chryseobacterium gambrini]|uniref:helicase associated domain-containing protein n=2 Tax=Chryseobacterium TaxID=59732 RepID=UPI0022F18F08|nr:sigma factor-like helix-turn-helix DNA-binding protein [Chryseobacterium gambrini]WBV53379.1 sigma factor-like helix-turn-helix DNA-binding protein [Chryseobacterium gambrini]
MTIDEIYKNNEISVRSYNICKYNSLESLDKLIDYYFRNHSFETLRNCGRRSNRELIDLCRKYETNIINNTIEKANENTLEETIVSLSRIQREVINSFILVNTNSLSVRSKNAISQFLNGNFSVRNFAEKILLNKKFILASIDNVGKKSILELEVYISIVNDFIISVKEANDEHQLITLKNSFLIRQTFSISKIPIEILQSESIFQLTDFLFENNAFFNKNHNSIIQQALKIYNNTEDRTLEEIAIKNNLSRERVRQIRKDCINELFEKLSFIKNFNDDLFQNYGIDLSLDIIEVKENLVSQINIRNKTNFSKEFISYILAVYLNDNFSIIGNIEDILQPKYFNNKNRHNWNNFYIFNKKLSKIDFISFANDIDRRLNDRIEETYSFNLKSYLSRFIDDLDIEVIEPAFPVAEKIINDEFALYLDVDDNIIFKKNTIKQAFEYSCEALENLGKPSKVEEITKKIKELHPNYETDEKKVRASMKRKDGFVPIGRTSVFGLKKWENEIEDFRGGTIRSISTELLEQSDNPKHISEITEHVLKYRPNSNEKSIYYNLRIDESETYSFFKNSYVGLKKKNYSEDFEILKNSDIIDRNSWEERYEDLQKFLLLENRLPFSNGVPEEEIRLYRWLNVQKRKIRIRDLDEQKSKLIIEVFEKFPLINGRRRLNSTEKYDELLEFIKDKQRLPDANKQGEENLYQFFYKQRKLYDNDELDNHEKSYFSKVCQIFKNLSL